MAPSSSALSFTASPEMQVETEPALPSSFFLPPAEMSYDGDNNDELGDPVSRISSPAHKAPRLAEGVNHLQGAMLAMCMDTSDNGPSAPAPSASTATSIEMATP